ncbi:fimbria/pilus outer membrane usher protein [Serratia microhaemolytica]|uniref:fimbria/pilus outer membrane usher protein n=1 Tax=Serratia microhaemolytica TaxID=2675110 RepID=UPI000FDECA70|nr:fimbria/pilus outer membrane usher protein [Serratia microhaemolytica]
MKNYSPSLSAALQGGYFRYHPLAWCLLLTVSPSWAADYFDPSFLGEPDENINIDLSPFAEPGGVAPGEYTLWVFVNQRSVGRYALTFQKNAQGKVAPVFTPEQLNSFGVAVDQVPSLKGLAKDSQIDNLTSVVPQAVTKLDLPRLRLDISVPQIAMQRQLRGAIDPSQWQDGIPALMANYHISAGHTSNDVNGETHRTKNLFTSIRPGLNLGPWRLRSTFTYSRLEYSGRNNKPDETRTESDFNNTYLMRDIAKIRSSLLVGQSNTGSDIFDSVPFLGMKLQSNEQMLPAQLRGFSPAISGIANTNARITVRQGGNIIYETFVAPGPFYINDLPQAGLSGDYDVTVTESDGSQRRFVVPYSSLPVMLRPGAWKYELTTGRYDGNLTHGSRKAVFVLGTGVYGLPKGFTLYGGLLGSDDYQALSLGSGVSLGMLGAISLDVTQSWAKFDKGSTQSGQSYRFRYSKSMLETGTTFDLTAMRYSTENFYSFHDFNSLGHQLKEGIAPWLLQRRRTSFQTQISQQMGKWGSVSFRATRDDFWGDDRKLTGLSFSYSNSLKGISYSINYNIDRVSDENKDWPENRQISFNISVPFSIFGYAKALQSAYAVGSISHDNDGRTQNQIGIMGSALDGRISYGITQNWGNQGQPSSTSLTAGYQGSKGSINAGYSYSSNTQSVNLNASGSVLVHAGGVTFARGMGESVALVHAPGARGVSVNGATTVTDSRGYAIVPHLSNYLRNSIGLDPSTLPEGVNVVQTNVNVFPTNGAVVKAEFATRVGYQALMTLKYGTGFVPFGATASLLGATEGEENGSIVGDSGQIYMTGLPATGELLVKWGESDNRQCRVNFNVAAISTSPDRPMRQVTYECR